MQTSWFIIKNLQFLPRNKCAFDVNFEININNFLELSLKKTIFLNSDSWPTTNPVDKRTKVNPMQDFARQFWLIDFVVQFHCVRLYREIYI